MAKFRQYNIQLLPLDTVKTPEVGIEGYKKLFDQLSTETSIAFKNKKMANQAKALINDTFICPFVVHTDEKFAYGKFVKYNKADTVTDFYDKTPLFEATKEVAAVSNVYYFRFVFDYTWHRFGIEENGTKLPKPDVMLKVLEHFLEKSAKNYFPDHSLTLNLISDQVSMNEALTEGNQFGSVDVKITFPNSHRLNDELRELKKLNAHNIQAHVSPARGAQMPGLPEYIRKLVEMAPEFGEATITFFKAISNNDKVIKFKRMIYSSTKNPRYFILRQKKNEGEFGFVERAWRYMKALADKNNETK
ncbi:MAG: DUF4747 family protein [Nitrosomonas sp.]|uniref:DUF4747 family protein n=1 Tax=Nitrosomonas sp. TaxID=42353 RepID=UPI0032ED2B51